MSNNKKVKLWADVGRQEQKKLTDGLAKIKDKSAGDTVPDLKAANSTLAEILQILLKSDEVQNEKIGKMEEEMNDIKEVKKEFIQLKKEVGDLGKKFEAVESKLEVLDALDKNMKEIQKEQRENTKTVGEAAEKMEEERKKLEEMRERAEQDKRKKDEDEVAACIMVMGLAKGDVETYRDLESKVNNLLGEGLGLNPGVVDYSKVERFGSGKVRGNAEGAEAAAARPERPPLVRITLMQASMKGLIFGNIGNLRGKPEFARISIQNEVPRGRMDEHKETSDRAKSYREDAGVKTRISWAKGPMTVLIKVGRAGVPEDWVPEDKLDDDKWEELRRKSKK